MNDVGRTHTLVAMVADHPGVLTRVASMFRRRGFNIASLAVGNCEKAGYSRMTIEVNGTDDEVKQFEKQLYKLVEVVTVRDLTDVASVKMETALVRVRIAPEDRPGLADIAGIFRGEIVDVASDSMIVQITAVPETIDRFMGVIAEYGIDELSRTGVVAMARGSNTPRNGSASG
jgi:acetolactate synthase-1/3 small subunit